MTYVVLSLLVVITGDTLDMRERCRGLCELDGASGSFLCLNYCLSFPGDPACPDKTIVNEIAARTFGPTASPIPSPSISPTQAPTTNCYVGSSFAKDMNYCNSKLCTPFLWNKNLTASAPTNDPTAFDVCSSTCSRDSLGTAVGLYSSTTAIRAGCQNQCKTYGYQSYLCQVSLGFEVSELCQEPHRLRCNWKRCTILHRCTAEIIQMTFPAQGLAV